METAKRKRSTVIAIIGASTVALWIIAWLVVAVIVPLVREAECAGIEFGPSTPSAPGPRPEPPPIGGTGGIAGDLRSALRSPGEAVYCDDFADPFVLRVGSKYYAYGTNTGKFHVPVLTSSGLFGTARVSDALPRLPSWTTAGKVWAPAVLARPAGFVLYYATAAPDGNRECLSRAFAASPRGPFVDESTGPFVCPPTGGAIDPSPAIDAEGRAYLYWKEYGRTDGIVGQELTPDGLGLAGEPTVLLTADEAWEGGIVEGPSVVENEGRYYLFYSGNQWSTAAYAMGYAVCTTPLGPCLAPAGGPWLASTDRAEGPGGGEIFRDDDGQIWLVLHAWVRGRVGYPDGARNLFVVPLVFSAGIPSAA